MAAGAQSRVDVAEATAIGHGVQLGRVMPHLGTRRVDEITVADIAQLVATLHAAGYKRETIRKSVTVARPGARLLRHQGQPGSRPRPRSAPARRTARADPPVADQIEAVLSLMPRLYALAVLVLDATGMRVGELEEKGLHAATSTNQTPAGASAAPSKKAGADAGSPSRPTSSKHSCGAPAARGPFPDRPVFPGLTQERLRTAIARACKASGTPTWSPHDLRHRRISLWHRQGETWALIGSRVGQRSLSITADTYTHVLLDDRELDHAVLVAEPEDR